MAKRCMGCMEEYADEYEVCPHCGYIEGTKPKIPYHIIPGEVLVYRYTIGKVLGYGSFGVTYIGWDNLLEKKVAIKEYLPNEFVTRVEGTSEVTVFDGEKSQQFTIGKDKFTDEAKKLATFNKSKGIIAVYDQFEDNGTSYIVMDYFEGETLQSKMNREGKINYEEALNIILPILNSLQDVHNAGIIHRDISPDNIYITKDGDIKLLDFGAARYASTNMSKSLSAIYKQGYAPYEQYQSSREQGPWSDVYALSATLYYMITGIVPQEAMNRLTKKDDKVISPKKLDNDIPKNLSNAIMNALIVYPQQRTQSINEFKAEIENVQTEIKKTKYPKEFLIPTWAKISTAVTSGLLVVLCLLLAFGVIDLSSILGDNSRKSLGDNETYIPGLINLAVYAAEKEADDSQIVMQITDKVQDDKIEPNKVMSQDPMPGKIMIKEGLVNVVVSKGKEQVVVPDVLYERQEDAVKKLKDAGFKVEIKNESVDGFYKGTAANQSVKGNSVYDKGSKIILTIAQDQKNLEGDGIVDNYTNKSLKDTVETLKKKGLYTIVVSRKYSNTVPAGCIISQNPTEGTQLENNKYVEVIVSLGKEMVLVPDVQYKKYDSAKKELETLGFKVKKVEENSDLVEKGKVIKQNIKANTKGEKGKTITITVSKGSKKLADAKKKTDKYNKDVVSNNKPQPKPSDNNVITNEWTEWTTDASKLNDSRYIVEKKTQYSSKETIKKKTVSNNSNLSGWTLYDKKTTTNWGNWSSWQDGAISSNSNREVRTRKVTYTYNTGRKLYNYSHWVYRNSGRTWYTWSETYARKYGGWYEERGWGKELYLYTLYDGKVYGTANNGTPIWFYEKVKNETATGTKTQYSYRSIDKSTKYYYKREITGTWSNWQDAKINPSDNDSRRIEVKTRTLYRYKKR